MNVRRIRVPLIAALVFALAAAASITASGPANAQCTIYTTDEDFDLGELDGVNHDPPNNHQLQLSPTATTFPFAWVANSGEGTVSKVDTSTGKEVARYRTGPSGAAESPSRTSVDRDGNCWVANRAFGIQPSVVQILIDGGVDRNGNFTIETSRDLNDDGIVTGAEVLPWGADERVARFYKVSGINSIARALTIDRAGFLWVGLFNDRRVVKLDPDLSTATYAPLANGTPPVIVSIPTAQTYGLATAPNAHLYLATLTDAVQEIDPGAASMGSDPPRVLQTAIHSGQNYGIAVDAANIVWLGDLAANRVIRWDPALGGSGFSFGGGAASRGRGVTVDFDGNIWMACDNANQVAKYRPTNPPTLIFNASAACALPVGVGTAADGHIIAVGQNSNSWGKIDKDTGATIPTGGPQLVGSLPYTYSDFTGSLLQIIGRQGFWTIVQDGGSPGEEWGNISWTSFEPSETSVTVEARAADTVPGLASATYIPVTNGVDISIFGRYIQVRARLTTDREDLMSPILYDLTICNSNQPPICDAGSDYEAECQGTTTSLALDGTGSIDPDGDALTYEWSTDCPGGIFDDHTSPTPILTVDSSCGCEFSCSVTLTVDDGRESATCSADVDIVDTTRPVIIPNEDHVLLWPPNHKYEIIDVGSCIAEVTDGCDGTVDLSSVVVTSVTSDEPENAPGMGDGNTVDDIIIVCPNTVKLRAEREGGAGHNGRVYTIHYSVADESGNVATASCQVGVPHDPSRPTIDGPGPGYEETGCTPEPLGPTPPTDGFRLSRPTELGMGVSFSLEQTGTVRLDVYDIHGRLLERREAELSAGAHTLHWAGVDRAGKVLPSGMYIFRLDADGTITSQKGIWIR